MTTQQPDLKPQTIVSQPYSVGNPVRDRRKSAIITGAGSGTTSSLFSEMMLGWLFDPRRLTATTDSVQE